MAHLRAFLLFLLLASVLGLPPRPSLATVAHDPKPCPAGMAQRDIVVGTLRRTGKPQRQDIAVALPQPARLIILGWVQEGHPDECPGGRNCNQGQRYEEFRVFVNEQMIGEYRDQTPGDAWFEAGPWSTEGALPAGTAQVSLRHRMEGKTVESVAYVLTICAEPAHPPGPPCVSRVLIAADAATVREPDVQVQVDVDADPQRSAAQDALLIEYEVYGEVWIPIRSSSWISFTTPSQRYPWRLSEPSGAKYLQAWVRDRTGAITTCPQQALVNYLAPDDAVARGEGQVYRYTLAAGERFSAAITPVSGDPDLYIWPPDHAEGRPPWVSNRHDGPDRVGLVAPVAGVYQIEVFGYSDARYRLDVARGSAGGQEIEATRGAPRADGQEARKEWPSRPLLPVERVPDGAPVRVPAEPPLYIIYLPALAQ